MSRYTIVIYHVFVRLTAGQYQMKPAKTRVEEKNIGKKKKYIMAAEV